MAEKPKTVFVDLDGTITNQSLNNTFDFIRAFLAFKEDKIRLLVYRVIAKILDCVLLTHNQKVSNYVRRLRIKLLFYGQDKIAIDSFAKTFWITHVKKYLNIEVVNFLKELKNEGYTLILLTACVETPAKQIAEQFAFDDCICTKFRFKHGKINGVKVDCFGEFKFKSLKRKYPESATRNAAYILDYVSLPSETFTLNFFEKVYLVKDGKIKQLHHNVA
jgi:phosphoserine phosphatase